MRKINEQDLLNEIRFDIKKKDILKAKLVLTSLDFVSRETQKKVLFEVSRAEDDFSIPLLTGVIANNLELIESFPQIKETLIAKILDSPQVLLNLLRYSIDKKEKTLLIETTGELQLDNSVPVLLDVLREETDVNITKSLIESLGIIGDPSAVNPISEHLFSNNKDIVIAASKALGDIGTAETVNKLSHRLGGEKDLDLMILDNIAKLQIPEAYEELNNVLSSEFVHLRTEAKKKLIEIGSMSIRFMIINLTHRDPDVVIHSLSVIGDLGDGSAIPYIRKLLFNEPDDPNVRFAAYETLGRLPLDKGAFTLATGLEDTVNNVRSAAARAINHNYNPVLGGGIKNMIQGGGANALNIITTIIDTQCDKIFMDLLEDDLFKDPAIKYLKKKAHPEIKGFFARLLAEAGYKDLAQEITPDKKTKETGRLKVFAVDDSQMILNIYRTILHNLKCESKLFEFPADALKCIDKEKPDIILTDLNMPDISGIDLTINVRKVYKKDELPIIMITTQDEARDKEAAYDAGINGILQKPFSEGQIGKVLKKFTGYKLI